MVTILAVLKCGSAYVPVDPVYPISRIIYILRDTKAPLIVTTQSMSAALQKNEEFPSSIKVVDMENSHIKVQVQIEFLFC